MLPRNYRLSGNQIPQVLKKGKRFSSPLFNLVVYKRRTTDYLLPTSRFAFVVSLKIEKRAVVRNRTKRLLSEAVRLLLPKIKKDYKIVLFAKKPLKKEKLQDILSVLKNGLKKAGLLV